MATVSVLALPRAAMRVLSATLVAANTAIDRGNTRLAGVLLRAFILEMRALERRGLVPASAADDLIGQAQRIAGAL